MQPVMQYFHVIIDKFGRHRLAAALHLNHQGSEHIMCLGIPGASHRDDLHSVNRV
jgi:hypothetical protein